MARIVIHLPSGETSHALDAPLVTVGRVAGNAIQIDDPSVSAHHAKFYLRNGRYFLRDLNSTNKTWIENEAVDCAALQGTCAIRFGTIDAEFADEIGEAPTAGFGDLKEQLKNVSQERDAILLTNRELAGKLVEEANRIEVLARERETEQGKLRDLTDKHASLEKSAAELVEAKARMGSMAAEIETANATLSTAKTQAADFEAELAKQGRIANELAGARQEIESMAAERDRLETASAARIAEFQSATAAAERGREEARAELSKRIEELEKGVSTAIGERDEARTILSQQTDELEKKVAVTLGERDEARTEREHLRTQGEALRQELAAQKEEMDRSHRHVQELQDQIETQRAEVHTVSNQRDTALRKSEEQNSQIATLRQSGETANTQRDALTAKLAEQSRQAAEALKRTEQLTVQYQALDQELEAANQKVVSGTAELTNLKSDRDAADDARGQLSARLTALETELDHLRTLKDQHFALAAERDALKTEVASLIDKRNSERDLAAKLASAEQQLELFAAQQRAVTAELERAKLAERELNSALAESPRLVKWLHGGLQKQAALQAKADLEANKIVSIDAGKNSITEAVEKMRRAVELCEESPAEGLRELGLQLGAVNDRTESSPHRRAVHRLGSTLGLLIGEMRSAPHTVRPSGLQTVSNAIEVLAQLLREENPPVPVASAIIVDRDVRTVQTVIAAMKSIEFKIFCAEELRSALETLAGEHHDLILLDWHTSESTSDLHQIRAMPSHQQTPVIFLARPENETAARAGGDDVLVKPLTAPEVAVKSLTTVLNTYLANSRHEPVFTIQ